jgi:hypothetical protein
MLMAILNLQFLISNQKEYRAFEVLTTVIMKRYIFWYTTPCSPSKVNGNFGGIYNSIFKVEKQAMQGIIM